MGIGQYWTLYLDITWQSAPHTVTWGGITAIYPWWVMTSGQYWTLVKMLRCGARWWSLLAALTLWELGDVLGVCPHSEVGLMKWSNASTWSGVEPQTGDQVKQYH